VTKDKTIWSKVPLSQYQTTVRNIVKQRAGAHRSTETLLICDTFKKMMSNEMIDIVRCTKKKALIVYEEYDNKSRKAARMKKCNIARNVRIFRYFVRVQIIPIPIT